MIFKSFSKINLSLSVNKKLKKRELHEIQSYFCLIDVFDLIKIRKIKGKQDIIKFKGTFAKNINKKNNSIRNTLIILREAKIISNYYSVTINKKIPTFAGMGGGTSNAVSLMRYFIKRKTNNHLFKILEKKIGSDLKLFFFKQGFLTGLNKVKYFKKKYKFHFLLVYPNLRCSTRDIYSKVVKHSLKSNLNLKKINEKNKFIELLSREKNDLQLIVEKKHPVIKKLTKEIGRLNGCYFSRMTGSGSVCYGLFRSEKTAKIALNKMKLMFPNYWFSTAKTI